MLQKISKCINTAFTEGNGRLFMSSVQRPLEEFKEPDVSLKIDWNCTHYEHCQGCTFTCV